MVLGSAASHPVGHVKATSRAESVPQPSSPVVSSPKPCGEAARKASCISQTGLLAEKLLGFAFLVIFYFWTYLIKAFERLLFFLGVLSKS